MTTLYYEPGTGGHRAAFLAAVMLYGDDSWVVACPKKLVEALDETARSRIAPRGPIRHFDIRTEYLIDFGSIKEQWAQSQEIAEKMGCENVFHPMIDLFAHYSPFLRIGSVRTSGIYFRPTQHYEKLFGKDWIIAKVKGILGRYFLSRRDAGVLFSLDRFFPAWAGRHWKHGWRVRFLPDLVPISESIVRVSGIDAPRLPDDKIRFLLFGALQRRKGVFEVLEAIEKMDCTLVQKCDFRFCGQLSADAVEFPKRLAQVVAGSSANIGLEDRFLSDSELAREVAAADVILAPYQWHKGSSGVLYWAAAFGKPVIGQEFGLIGLEIRDYSLGLCVRPGDVNALANALSEVVRRGGLKVDRSQQQRFLAGHGASDFVSLIEKGLKDAS